MNCGSKEKSQGLRKPNIIIIYADDLGFGDVSCYGASALSTPHIDELAEKGIRFNHGYATAATCTPSRYSLMTGSYPWRNPDAAIMPGDAPLLIPAGSETLPSQLKKAGYRTAVIGKWHMGLGTPENPVNWNRSIQGTPNDLGFDRSFIMAATNDRVPCVYIRDREVENLDRNDPISVKAGGRNPFPEVPSGRKNRDLLQMDYSHGHDGTIINGVSRIGHMRGGSKAVWKDETMAETFVKEARRFIEEDREEPFFLYYALHQPHVPRIPSPRFRGATELGPRGDVIVELDWCVGEIMKSLEEQGVLEETIVIFSSDNGPVLDDGYKDKAEELKGDHSPAGPLRGGKYSLFDGGTRVPFILSWPGTVEAGVSESLVCQVDFFASFAALTGESLSTEAAPDSENILDAFLDHRKKGRTELVTEGTQGNTLLRQEDTIFIAPHLGPRKYLQTNTESGNSLLPQLYNIKDDEGQIRNRAAADRETARTMKRRLREIRRSARTRSI